MNAGDGGFAWGIALPKGARDPVVVDGVAYFGSDDWYVRAVRVPDGALLWTSPKLNDGVTAVPAVADGKVFVGTWNSRLYALNASTGIVEWVYVVSPLKHVFFFALCC